MNRDAPQGYLDTIRRLASASAILIALNMTPIAAICATTWLVYSFEVYTEYDIVLATVWALIFMFLIACRVLIGVSLIGIAAASTAIVCSFAQRNEVSKKQAIPILSIVLCVGSLLVIIGFSNSLLTPGSSDPFTDRSEFESEESTTVLVDEVPIMKKPDHE